MNIDMNKLEELEKSIEEKNDKLLEQICNTLANGQDSEYNYLKQLQLQCNAELRLIKHIKNNFEDDFMIC